MRYNSQEVRKEKGRMNSMLCPHCKAQPILDARVHQDVIVVASCPGCHELSVLFRGRVIPLDRRVLEEGSFDERKEHLAAIIAQFMEAGFSLIEELRRRMSEMDPEDGEESGEGVPGEDLDEARYTPISEEELQKFVRVDLKCLDNADYFRRHFR